MTTLEQFIRSVEAAEVRLTVDGVSLAAMKRARDDSFFQSPLLSLCAVVVAKGRDGDLKTADVPTWVGAALTKHFDSSAVIRRQLDWSLDYRRRCADAIVFLENLGLVQVSLDAAHSIKCTERGQRFIREALRQANETGVLVRGLTKAYRIVEYHGLELF